MKDIEITREIMPVIEINFEELKENLTESLTKYNGIIVTKETLAGCKATQKDLAGLRIKIDNYRKDKKKELSQPITEFEAKCNNLISLVKQAEAPILEGIKVFDDETRQAKRDEAMVLINEVIAENDLNAKYASRLVIADKYCNLTAKASEVKTDLSQIAFALKVEQDREAELIDILVSIIETENQRIKTQLKLSDFQRQINNGVPTKDIAKEIKERAEQIWQAENPVIVEEVPEPMQGVGEPAQAIEPAEEPIEELKQVEPPVKETMCYANIRMVGSLTQLKGVIEFTKHLGLAYEVLEQGEL